MATKVKKTPIAELAREFVNCKMNCDLDHNPTRVLQLLGPKHNDITSLRNHFIEEKERLTKKDGKYEFERWYSKDIVKILDELIDSVIENRPLEFERNEVIGSIIIKALKEGHMFRGFNWNNYEKLVAENLSTLFNEFDSDFRGDITVCHNVAGKYIVIETESHPFDFKNQKYKTKEPKEKKFYSTEYRKDKLFLTSMVWHTFEEALFHTMAPSQYSAMSILFEAANKED